MSYQQRDRSGGTNGPLNKAVNNMQAFCESLIYSSVCDMTIKAIAELGEQSPNEQTTSLILDQELYLTTLFLNPLEANV